MGLDAEKLVKDMTGAAAQALATKWPNARSFAEPQIRKLADEITRIEALLAARKITADDASDRIAMLEEAFQSVMGTAEAIAVLEVERAVNAVLAAMPAPVEKGARDQAGLIALT